MLFFKVTYKLYQLLMTVQRGLDKRYCQDFQSDLSIEKIDSIWKNFRDAGNSIEGRILRSNFKKIMNKFGYRQKILDRLFDRFKMDKHGDKSDRDEVDLQDFVIGLAILSRIPFLHKIKFLFYLTDLDEDGCLSLQQIENMIERIEKIFAKENSAANVDSSSLLFELAHKKATRNYNQMLFLLKRNNKQLKNDQGGLITSDQFIEALRMSKDLYQSEKFIPLNLSLSQILDNVASQPSIKISQNVKKSFVEFRQELCSIMQGNEKEAVNVIKYPGKVEILRNDKVVETLPVVQKMGDKKGRATLKNKPNPVSKVNYGESRDPNDQKSPEQNLETYKTKVKKMIETKQDPRLNVRFDTMYKKS